jgi:ribosome modulation factor
MSKAHLDGWNACHRGDPRSDAPSGPTRPAWLAGWDEAQAGIDRRSREERFLELMSLTQRATTVEQLRDVLVELIDFVCVKEKTDAG